MNASDGVEAAVIAATIGWIKFRECEELLNERKLSLKIKRIYRSCIRSEMLYGNETWRLRENEILKKS